MIHMEESYAWLYIVIFMMIPLLRIMPRIIRKVRGQQMQQQQRPMGSSGRYGYDGAGPAADAANTRNKTTRDWNVKSTSDIDDTSKGQESRDDAVDTASSRHQTSDMHVLGQMIAGAKTFETIQKYTGISTQKLDKTLQDLEARKLIVVKQKQGVLGVKVELYPTSKGVREFHN